MSRLPRLTALAVVLGLGLSLGMFAGCDRSASKEKAKTPPAAAQETRKPAEPGGAGGEKPPAKADEHAGHEHPKDAAHDHSKHEGHDHAPPAVRPAAKADPEGLKELSAADRALAEKQGVCPVTDEPLGSMGTPIKLTVEGQTVFICCAHCEEDLRKEPQKYLAKLRK